MIRFLTDTPWVLQAVLILGGFLVGILTELILVRTFHTLAKRTKSTWDDLLIEGIHQMPIVWATAAGLWGAMLVRGVDPYIRSILGKILTVIIIGSLALVMVGGTVGTYAGLVYGQNVDPNYLGRSYAIENGLHFGAATGAILVSTALGLFNEIKTKGR